MYQTIKQQLKHLTKKDYNSLCKLTHYSKNLYNQALYNVRQRYFEDGSILRYEDNYKLLKDSPNYKMLNSNMAQQILKKVDGSMRSFLELKKLAVKGEYDPKKVKLPHYLEKDSFFTLIIGFVRFKDNKLIVPYSREYAKDHDKITITVPPVLKDKKVKEIKIVPRYDARYFEIHYSYESECIQRELDRTKALAIDLGVNNLMTCVTSEGRSFIIDGRKLKSYNQWYNKENARLQGIKDKQKYGDKLTKRQVQLIRKRNNRVNDYIYKALWKVIRFCDVQNIGRIILGYNDDFQLNSNIGKQNNQAFVNIPYGKLKERLEYLCELNGIELIIQEESYTSDSSFWDKDYLPVFGEEGNCNMRFSGKRIKRGVYRRWNGDEHNADVNGALNIMRKSSVVDMSVLYSRGKVDVPVRIRVA